ncbi:MAG TPA: cell division ATP-binding protein FtsE [Thermodesulfobacteriota bacterium]|nr:cell division ATP-binding protein FtsE [Thermodesulfobacteriota bacterium]
MIQLLSVSKNFDGVRALDSVTLTIEKGEFVFVTGPSGAGKSTLLNIIFGAEAPTEGHILIEGRDYLKIPRREIMLLRQRTGFIFQDFKLINTRTVFENVALSLKVMGVKPAEIQTRVAKALSDLKLEHRANLKPLNLSGGEQQKVDVARALVKEPAFLLADEPTGNLDPEAAVEMLTLFKEENAKGTTVVIATHDKGIISMFNNRVVTLSEGRLAGQ